MRVHKWPSTSSRGQSAIQTAVPYSFAASAATRWLALPFSPVHSWVAMNEVGSLIASRPWRNAQGFTGLLPSKGRA